MKVVLGLLTAAVFCLPLMACDAPSDCMVIASNCASATTPDGCSCEGSNGTSWTCEYAEGSEDNCCEDDPEACTDEE